MELIKDFSMEEYISHFIHSLCPGGDNLYIYSEEVISELIRHVSYELCPCIKTKLQNAVIDLVEDLFPDNINVSIKVKEVLEELIVLGDLLELPPMEEDSVSIRALIYLSPLKYVKINDTRILLLGIDENVINLSEEVKQKIHPEKSLKITVNNNIKLFEELGYYELSVNEWLKFEKYKSSSDYVNLIQQKLEILPKRPEKLDGIIILDDKTGSKFYKGRWSELNSKHYGYFVARRKVLYGSDLWCYLEVKDNVVLRILDLPALEPHLRPYDEAWRLQMAIDSNSGIPQKYNIREISNTNSAIDFFSPLPSWAVRHMEVNGLKSEPQNCLFTYSVNINNISNLEDFLRSNLWIQKT